MATRCNKCKKEIGIFSRVFTCSWCGIKLCSKCIEKVDFGSGSNKDLYELDERKKPYYSITKLSYVLCPTCAKQFRQEIKSAEKSIIQSKNVELVSINYLGRKKYSGVPKRITSDWHRDKNECREDLRRLAAFNSYSIVIDVKTEKELREYDNYKYNVFRMTGKAYKKN